MMQRSPLPAFLGRFSDAQLAGLTLSAKRTRGQIISVRTAVEMRRDAAAARLNTLACLAVFVVGIAVVAALSGWL